LEDAELLIQSAHKSAYALVGDQTKTEIQFEHGQHLDCCGKLAEREERCVGEAVHLKIELQTHQILARLELLRDPDEVLIQ
jgi:hypothetical protein